MAIFLEPFKFDLKNCRLSSGARNERTNMHVPNLFQSLIFNIAASAYNIVAFSHTNKGYHILRYGLYKLNQINPATQAGGRQKVY